MSVWVCSPIDSETSDDEKLLGTRHAIMLLRAIGLLISLPGLPFMCTLLALASLLTVSCPVPVSFPPIAVSPFPDFFVAPSSTLTSVSGVVVRSARPVALVEDVLCEDKNEGVNRGLTSSRGLRVTKSRKEGE
jgi:hypothetical protein